MLTETWLHSHQAEAILALLRERRRNPGYDDQSYLVRRQELETMAEFFPLPDNVKVDRFDADGVPAAWITTDVPATDRCILYCHGGGYFRGSIRSHQELVARLAVASGASALLFDYRLAPEHRYPAALEDAETVYRFATERAGIAPEHVVMAGDSAGGGLALALLTRLRDAPVPLPAGVVLLSPWTDLRVTGLSTAEHDAPDPLNSLLDFVRTAGWYLGDHPPEDPLVSPALASLHDLPPMFVLADNDEMLFDNTTRLAKQVVEVGGSLELVVAHGLFHVWPVFPQLPESVAAVEQMAAFVRRCVPD
jgi:epsilon-lactone hydrolase